MYFQIKVLYLKPSLAEVNSSIALKITGSNKFVGNLLLFSIPQRKLSSVDLKVDMMDEH
jgi:hypothetical protein